MSMRRNYCFILVAIGFCVSLTGCKNEFEDEVFLRKQSQAKLRYEREQDSRDSAEVNFYIEAEVQSYIEALNTTGDLLSVTMLMRENGNPLEAVTVTLTTGTPEAEGETEGRAKTTLTGQTDASGNVTFENVVIGRGTISFAKPGYLSSTAAVNFGYPSGPVAIDVSVNGAEVTRYAPPAKRHESGVVNMFSTDLANSNTAIITGRVTIENDVTNLTPEYPVGQKIRANLASFSSGGTPAFFVPGSFAFADDHSIGVGTIGEDGMYSLIVPATATGKALGLIIDNIVGTRRTAVNGYDNGSGSIVTLADGPQYIDVPTRWGPQAGGTSAIPTVIGARVVIPPPPPAGAGLDFDFTPVPRQFAQQSSLFSSSVGTEAQNIVLRINNRGNFGNSLVSPEVVFSGGGGTGAQATAEVETYLSKVVVTNPGAGYVGPITLTINAQDQSGTKFPLGVGQVDPVNGGLPLVIDLTSIAGDGWGADDDPEYIDPSAGYTLVSLDVSSPPIGAGAQQAVVDPTFVTQLNLIEISEPGSGYTSAPTIQITHPNHGVVPATVEILDFKVFWELSPNNSASTDYALLPENLEIIFPTTKFFQQTSDDVVDQVSHNGVVEENDLPLLETLMTQNGDVVKKNPGVVLRTTEMWGVEPYVLITPVETSPARAAFSSIFSIDQTSGAIISFPTQQGLESGYATPITGQIVPSIAGAPGSGATLRFTSTLDQTTREWDWTGNPVVTTPGSGYLRNLNRKASQGYSATGALSVQAGKSYIVNISYGTGFSLQAVN